MRYPMMLLALAGASLLTGCSSLISLNPFITDAQATTDPRLAGTWKNPNADDKDAFTIEQKGSRYVIKFTTEKSETTTFDARVARIGDMEFMDLVDTDDNPFVVPVHMLIRVWMNDGKLQWAILDSRWLREQVKDLLPTQENEDRTLITTQGSTVTELLQKFGAEERAHGDTNDLVKIAK